MSCCLAYSFDFRKHVLKVKQTEKLTCLEVSDRFGLSIGTFLRWQQRIIPKTKPNKPSTKLNLEAWRQDVEDQPDHFQYPSTIYLVEFSCQFPFTIVNDSPHVETDFPTQFDGCQVNKSGKN